MVFATQPNTYVMYSQLVCLIYTLGETIHVWVLGGGSTVACVAAPQQRLIEVSPKGCAYVGDQDLWGAVTQGSFLNEEFHYLGGTAVGEGLCLRLVREVVGRYDDSFIAGSKTRERPQQARTDLLER